MKHLKIALLIAALTITASACSKVKTISLIGIYKNGNSTMMVSDYGWVNFTIDPSATGALASLTNAYASLVPWDLTSEKTSYNFSDTCEVQNYSSSTPTSYNVDLSFNFTKDKETITCKVNVTIPAEYGESGEVTFTK